jgi:hypothetical protein
MVTSGPASTPAKSLVLVLPQAISAIEPATSALITNAQAFIASPVRPRAREGVSAADESFHTSFHRAARPRDTPG